MVFRLDLNGGGSCGIENSILLIPHNDFVGIRVQDLVAGRWSYRRGKPVGSGSQNLGAYFNGKYWKLAVVGPVSLAIRLDVVLLSAVAPRLFADTDIRSALGHLAVFSA